MCLSFYFIIYIYLLFILLKIGVVGRTGAGKSTLTSALFKMVEINSGSIYIDNINIEHVGNDVLRSRLSIIPQDPVIFSGSIRLNLDPFGKHSGMVILIITFSSHLFIIIVDGEIWQVLDKVHLKQHVLQLPGQLDFKFKDSMVYC